MSDHQNQNQNQNDNDNVIELPPAGEPGTQPEPESNDRANAEGALHTLAQVGAAYRGTLAEHQQIQGAFNFMVQLVERVYPKPTPEPA